ncbi:MAG: LysR family transcriptional regulator [Clostridia bacterium]|nr:LysR family transcriptional regulator [Clostridia bacterium]
MVSFRMIEYLIALSEEGSFSLAAERLYISQPALSQAIRRMEQELGVTLLEKRTHRLRLTPEGTLMVREGRDLIARRDAMEHRMQELGSAHKATLHFGISPFYSKYYLPLVQPYFARNFPDARIQVTEEISVAIEQLLLEEKLDIGFLPREPENPRLAYEVLHTEEILLAVPADSPINVFAIPSPDLPRIELRHLAGEPFVALKPIQKFSTMHENLFRQTGFAPRIIHETMNWDTVNALAAAGIGSGFVPEMLRHVTFYGRAPRYYRLEGQYAARDYAAVWKKGAPPPALALQLMELFRSNLAQLTQN